RDALPMLRERFAKLDTDLLSGQRQAARDRQAWSSLLRELPGLDFRVQEDGADVAQGPLRTYDKTLSEAILRALARDAGCVIGARRATELADFIRSAGGSGRVLELGSGWIAELAFDRLRIRKPGKSDSPLNVEMPASHAGSVAWGPWTVSWREEPA